jgi:hypothetical protein
MSKQSELNSYLSRLQQRLRLGVSLRGVAMFTGTALIATVALVLILNRYAFPAHGVTGARWILIAALVVVAAAGVVWPLVRLNRARTVREAERLHPALQQRLTTFHERESSDPFLELLAADTLAQTESIAPSTLAPADRLFAFAGVGVACAAVLVWVIVAGPGYVGYGASLLWVGAKRNVAPLYAITVKPGDVSVRRNSDQLVIAEIKGMRPEAVQIFAHYASTAGWEPVAMQAQPDSGGPANYQFLFAGLPENVEYYVAAGPLVSPHYKVRVVDLPSVKAIHVTYAYPKWTGMKPVVEEHSGDLRAIEGTDAAIAIEMDRPLKDGQLTLDNGKTIQLSGSAGNHYQGTIHMEKDGAYHVAAVEEGQPVRLSEDYFIATDKAQPPAIAINRPGGDYRASPIEEVTVGVKAEGTFGLKDVHLHYSVNGGPDRDVSLLKTPDAKRTDDAYTLRLEDFKLVPGDLVSLYATAKDGHAESRTDITFIQAEPFEREFSQSQQEGGGGGGGGGSQNNQTEISKREKELIAATWKQQNDKAATPKDAATAGQFLADAQQKLRDQVMALSARMQSRDLSAANEEFTGFDKDMQVAASAMAASSDKLKGTQWKDALPAEQKALQALLRAEATFRQIQVAFSQTGGGGGGGGAGRDLASLFDLELDTEKNQYETAQTASPAEQHQKDVEDALEKLDALAKRQEDLANQQPDPQQSFQQRWQQEMLRREAEQLQRQLEQMAQNNQQDSASQQAGQQSPQAGQQSSKAQQGSQQNDSSSPSSQSGAQTQSQQGSQSGSQAGAQSTSSGSQQTSSSSNDPRGQSGSTPQSGSASAARQANGQSSRQSARGASDQQRIEDALSRVRQADEAMKRSGGGAQSTDAARLAAGRLRDATNLLGGAQQQLASGKMDALTRQADQIVQTQRAQSDRIDNLVKQQTTDGADMTQEGMRSRLKERDRLAAERQQLSGEVSKLQQNVRDAAREMAPTQPGVAQKLRDALTEMDQSDLDNHVQRTADWLRRGINPNSNGTEQEIAKGLQELDQQLRQAQQAVGQSKPGQSPGPAAADNAAALGQIERLRGQIEALSGARGAQSSSPQPSGRGGQSGQPGSRGQGGARQGVGANGAGARGGDVANAGGDTRTGGGGAGGNAFNNVNTGNNRYGKGASRPVPTDAAGNPADTERTYQQSMHELSQLRQMVQGDPQATKDVQALARQMQQLDPSHFPGNPAMVEQMHREVLSTVDRLELQMHRNESTEARSGKPFAVPAGYQDSVAEYYKRLSAKP